MTESDPAVTPAPDVAAAPPTAPMPAPSPASMAPAAPTGAPVYAGPHVGAPPVGKIRGTGVCVLLTIVTLGVYTWVWYYKTHSEMKASSGTGVGGGLALLLAVVVGIVMPFVTAAEVGGFYERRGQEKPVSAVTGLWVFLPFVGLLVWFVKTNGALNDYWRSLGAQG